MTQKPIKRKEIQENDRGSWTIRVSNLEGSVFQTQTCADLQLHQHQEGFPAQKLVEQGLLELVAKTFPSPAEHENTASVSVSVSIA
jgi:hypothetical protein